VPAVLLPEGVLGVRVAGRSEKASAQPFLGIIDCGSSFSVLSGVAARLAGLEPDDPALQKMVEKQGAPVVVGVGVDGKPMRFPLAPISLQLVGAPEVSTGRFNALAPLPMVTMAIGDLPVFTDLLGPRQGKGVALLGLDIWSQGRIIFQGAIRNGEIQRSIYLGLVT